MKVHLRDPNFFHTIACRPDKFPHLKNVSKLSNDTGDQLSLKVTIDSKNKHIYLLDHVFDDHCFVPATMIIELFFETGLFFCEYFGCHGLIPMNLRDLFIHRAIAVRPESKLDIHFLMKHFDTSDSIVSLSIDIISNRINAKGKKIGKRLNASSKVAFSMTPPQFPARVDVPQINFHFYHFDQHDLYHHYFPSLGSFFKSQTGRFAVDHNQQLLIGEFNCNNKEERYIKNQCSRFIISPLGYDSCLQYTVLLSRIKSFIGRLPVGCDRINIYSDFPSNDDLKVMIKCLSIDDVTMHADFWAFNNKNECLLTAQNVIVHRAPFHQLGSKKDFDGLLAKNKAEYLDW